MTSRNSVYLYIILICAAWLPVNDHFFAENPEYCAEHQNRATAPPHRRPAGLLPRAAKTVQKTTQKRPRKRGHLLHGLLTLSRTAWAARRPRGAHGRHKKRTTAWSFFWWCAIMLMPALNQQSSRPCLLGRRRCGLVLQGFRQLPAARLSSVCELKLLGLSSRILRPLREFR